MTTPPESSATDALNALGPQGLAMLLGRLAAPANGVQSVGLIDLATQRSAMLGDGAAPTEQLQLARGWFADGGNLRAVAWDSRMALLRTGGRLMLLHDDPAAVATATLSPRLDVPRARLLHGCVESMATGRSPNGAPPGELTGVWTPSNEDTGLDSVYARPGSALPAAFASLIEGGDARALLDGWRGKGSPPPSQTLIDAVALDTGEVVLEMVRVPFVPQLILILSLDSQTGERLWSESDRLATELLREVIREILGDGFESQMEPFPDTEAEFDAIVRTLRALPPDDLDGRLREAGFASHPVTGSDGTMRCQECIYYLPHRRWCDLPELPVPVEPDWYCRLWKL